MQAAAGDLPMWSPLTVHGSLPNASRHDRALAISSHVEAENSERGEWAFRDGHPVPLCPEPQVCKYEKLMENPGPFYDEDEWYARGCLPSSLALNRRAAAACGRPLGIT